MRWFLLGTAEEPAGSAGYWADFFFLKLLQKVSSSTAVFSTPVVLLLQRQLAASLTGSKPR